MAEIDALGATDLDPSQRPAGGPDTAERHMARLLEVLPAGASPTGDRPEGAPPDAGEVEPSIGSKASEVGGLLRGHVLSHAVAPAPRRGQTLGRYVVLGELGRGGMGIVLKAYDESLDRAVAIKLLHGDAAERQAPRLRREAQALAKLSHPNIVHVYEVVEEGGQWFLAMELVQGHTLRQWQQSAPRSWRDCVSVYLQAGEGLAAAHSAGLVHRDFKPDNCIIDDKGRPRVLDFGLVGDAGTRTSEELGSPSDGELEVRPSSSLDLSLTSTGAVMGTPAYMPIEQMRGREADARSDQFSFCVSLYEAIYGERPFTGRTMAALMVALERGDVRAAPGGTRVPAKLRTILLHGLAVAPSQRWSSMEALLAELRTLAEPRRRRWVGLGIVGGLAALGAGLAASRYMDVMHRCAGAADHLVGIWDDDRRQELRQAFLGVESSYAADVLERVESRLDEYAAAWIEKHTESCEATNVRQEQSSEVMDLRMECLRGRKVTLRETVNALAVADPTRMDRAIDVVEGLPRLSWCDDVDALAAQLPPPSDPEVAARVEELHDELERGRALLELGDYDAASEVLEGLVPRAERLDHPPAIAEVLLHRGDLRAKKSQSGMAEQDLERAYWLAVEQGHDEVAVASSAALLRILSIDRASEDTTQQWARTTLALARRPRLSIENQAVAALGVGAMLERVGRLDESLTHHERALVIYEQLYGPRHPSVADSLNEIGVGLQRLGRFEDSAAHHRRALAIFEEVHGPRHPLVATSLENLANVLPHLGEHDQALGLLQRALAIREERLGPRHAAVASSLKNIAYILKELGRLDESRLHFQRALATLEDLYGADHHEVASPLVGLAYTAQAMHDIEGMRRHAERALGIYEANGASSDRLASARYLLAQALWHAPAERARARMLAEQARVSYAELGSAGVASEAAVREWLDEHPPP